MQGAVVVAPAGPVAPQVIKQGPVKYLNTGIKPFDNLVQRGMNITGMDKIMTPSQFGKDINVDTSGPLPPGKPQKN